MTTPTIPTIDVTTLRTWLEEQRPLSVLDVRPAVDRSEWWIPESLHVDAGDALWRHDPMALATVDLPADTPVVAVCNAGKTSLLAADQLQARGLHALSLDGGMKAWSLAWNTADVQLGAPEVEIVQVRRTGKGCLSYLIGSAGVAAVIDASLPPEVYQDLASSRGWRITHVFDTHVHADHLSRSRLLAQHCNAQQCLPDQNRVSFPFTPVHDGDQFTIGITQLGALHTPGHTYESTSYLISAQDQPLALFTGDTLFPTAIGRPDLLAGADTHDRAKALYHSLQRLLALDPTLLVLGCHTSTPIPFDGQPITTTLAATRAHLAPMLASETGFIEQTLGHLPPLPANHQRIVAYNEAGTLPDGDHTELEAGANRCAVTS